MNENLLKQAIEMGIINIADVEKEMKKKEQQELLKQHPYKIWQGNDGKWKTYLPDEKKGRKLVNKTTEQAVIDAVVKYWKEESENPTIEDMFNEWNDKRLSLGTISSSTHERYQQVFRRHYKDFGRKKIKEVSWRDVEDFLIEQVAEHKLTSKAYWSLKDITKGLLKRGRRKGFVHFDPEHELTEMDKTDFKFKKVVKKDEEEVFDEVEYEKIITYLNDNLDSKNMGILLMFVTGLRVGELVALKREDFVGNTINVSRTEIKEKKPEGKGYNYIVRDTPKTEAGIRTVVIPSEFEWLTKKIILQNPFTEYVFLDKNGKRMTTNCFRRRLERINKKLGILHKPPHKIRKTYATILLDNQIDKKMVTDQMGHTSIVTTETKYHRNRKSILTKTEKLDVIKEFKAN